MSLSTRATIMRGLGILALVVTAPAAAAQTPSRPSILPGEPLIVYQGGTVAGGATPLRLVRPDGTDDHLLVPDDPRIADMGHPDWSPDGTLVAFDVWTPQPDAPARLAVWTVRVDGTDAREIARCELPCGQLSYPAWSPDGAAIALIRYDTRAGGDWGSSAIELLDSTTGERRVVAVTIDGTTAFHDPRWSPDGRAIVATLESYTDQTQGEVAGSSIVVVDAAGPEPATPAVITPPDLPATQPDWGPNDAIVLVTASAVGGWAEDASLMLVGSDGSELRPLPTLASSAGVASEPSWTPDGRIMFVAADRTGSRVALVHPDGGGLEQAAWSLQTPLGSIQRTHAHLRPMP